MKNKQEARKEIRMIRDGISAEDCYRTSAGIVQRLICDLDIDAYDTFLFYYALEHEVSLLSFASQLLSLKKQVAFPRVEADGMEFYAVHNIESDFSEGSFHVMEPVTGTKIVFTGRQAGEHEGTKTEDGTVSAQAERTLMLVPGLVFDRSFYRLGYGKGYYDRYLSAHPGITTVGICPDRFFMPEIPTDEHDIPMDMVCTESRLMKEAMSMAGTQSAEP